MPVIFTNNFFLHLLLLTIFLFLKNMFEKNRSAVLGKKLRLGIIFLVICFPFTIFFANSL
ncbi:protein of unknown function [Streptococcus thermophilus]|nr:protein of unknown function [Streptococcus thermophilus]